MCTNYSKRNVILKLLVSVFFILCIFSSSAQYDHGGRESDTWADSEDEESGPSSGYGWLILGGLVLYGMINSNKQTKPKN